MVNVAINGLGRIGRSILRILSTTAAQGDFNIVALNDIARPDLCAYLLKHDSVFGPFPGDVAYDEGALYINGRRCPLSDKSDLSGLDYRHVDVVLDCTGKASERSFAERALNAGAGRVLISGPCVQADQTIVLGANDETLSQAPIISCASCTTNALAPLVRFLDSSFGFVSGHMTTIHCYTGSQPTVDAPRGGFERSRAAALSMVPTTTSAGHLTDLVLPDLAGRITSTSLRVPTASVSAVDMTCQLSQAVDVDRVNASFKAASETEITAAIIGTTDEPLVSSDLRARPESVIVALPETRVTASGLLRVFGWYDNEWGFSNRMIELAKRMTR